MAFKSALLLGLAAVAAASPPHHRPRDTRVHRCPKTTTVEFDKSVPDKTDFPRTSVGICYDDKSLHLSFKAFEETNFYFDPEMGTNDDLWKYEVMEAFIYAGRNDPQTYLEYEINPNNVTYQAMIYNPSKVRAEGAPFDHFMVAHPAEDGFTASTELDRDAQTWFSDVTIPLGLFNIDEPCGSHWRMNFFRTVTSPSTYPAQELGAWSVPDAANFHITSFMRPIVFV